MTAGADAPVLSMRDISKSFGGFTALSAVDFDVHAGEVHAICGENGAGKSTLMKVLGGAYQPDRGDISLGGRPVRFAHPAEARRAGVSIIHQELSLMRDRSVSENVLLGIEPTRGLALDRRAMREQTAALLARVGARLDPDMPVGALSIAEQQLVEIAKALALDARVVVMDEPTAALDDQDAQRLLFLVRDLRAQGVAIVYISHRMPEIAALADRVTVLKDGKRVATEPMAALSPGTIVRMMVGRDLADFYPPRPDKPSTGAPMLEIAGGGNGSLRDIALTVLAGEIVGVAGLEGSGKRSLGRAIFGDDPFRRGTVRIAGTDGAPASPREAARRGVGYLSDDRKAEGITPLQSLRDNALLGLRAFAGLLRPPGKGRMAQGRVDAGLRALDVRAADFGQDIRDLSGGNQQKVVIARWLAREPRLIVFAEPTRGIDVAAKAAIYRIMRDLAGEGRAILMISSDLPEIVGVADRIVVMHEGRIAGELPGGSGEESVMELALGHRAVAA
ncbi:MAG: sugar ABC transporter ATP-binding protein [Mesorhizobium amorphae]|nr:MAG: sugar ABC transporter ATP-binding protein [Mesorhizobium amorphae]